MQLTLDDLRRQIANLNSLIDAGVLGAVALEAHSMKGAAANISAEGVHTLAAELEHAARAEQAEQVETRMEELRRAFSRLQDEFDDFLARETSYV